jgi:hypothetical protein
MTNSKVFRRRSTKGWTLRVTLEVGRNGPRWALSQDYPLERVPWSPPIALFGSRNCVTVRRWALDSATEFRAQSQGYLYLDTVTRWLVDHLFRGDLPSGQARKVDRHLLDLPSDGSTFSLTQL